MSQEQFKNALLSYAVLSPLIDKLHQEYCIWEHNPSDANIDYFYNQKEKLCIRFHQCILEDRLTKEEMKDIAYRLVWIFSKKYASTLDEEKTAGH